MRLEWREAIVFNDGGVFLMSQEPGPTSAHLRTMDPCGPGAGLWFPQAASQSLRVKQHLLLGSQQLHGHGPGRLAAGR